MSVGADGRLRDTERAELELRARRIRLHVLRAVAAAKSSHIGSAYSCIDLLVALYFKLLRIDPERPEDPSRDRFVLSKAHAGIALYATLAERGFFPIEMLREYYVDGGRLAGHADAHGVAGVELSAGALGHGLAVSVGMALHAKRLGLPWRVYCLLSDGECDEGSNWEAALLAAHLGLDQLTVVIDANRFQGMGPTEEIVRLEPLGDKLRAFNFAAVEIDGHDLDAIVATLADTPLQPGRPTAVVARTVKGKGVSFMEDTVLWHYRSPAGEELERALRELGA